MLEIIFRIGDRPLESMMTPRPEVVWLDISAPEEEIRHLIRASNHARFPVCDGDLDHILGVVQVKDLLIACLEGQPFDIKATMQQPLLVPEKMQALLALERFKQSGLHMALLFDEYGGIEGLVTLIDIFQAIIGDIPTLDETVEPPIVQREDGSWLVDGIMSIDDFKKAFAIRTMPGEDKYQTLAGFVVFMLGSIPTTGSHFGWGEFRFEVADMDGYRVDKVLLEAVPAKDNSENNELFPPIL
jgi:putative hemolysin